MHRYGKALRLVAAVLIAATMIVQFSAAALNWDASFSDVGQNEWYYGYVMECAKFEIVNGYSDGTFRPDRELTRGEFIKMLACSLEGLYSTTRLKGVHWAELYWNILNESGVLEDMSIPCTTASLDTKITRYEMAVMLRNALNNVYCENAVEVQSPETNIGDYSVIGMAYRSAVEQAYGKGILGGIDDKGSFGGDYTLTRAQAAKVIVLMLEPGKRAAVSFATEVTPAADAEDSFAFRYRNMSTEERRLALFGNADKSYFTQSDWQSGRTKGYIVDVQIQYWNLRNDGVTWYTVKQTVQVNAVVADEVKAIFDELYSLPAGQRFPIYSVGSARYSDALRHAWGCALDINATHNYYLNYSTGQQVGQYCYLNSTSQYCIRPDSAVVQTFARYGWGWGGSGWTSAVDYMHFSILASGG